MFATIAHIYVITHIRMHHEVTMHTPRYAEDTLIPNSEMPANSLSIQWVLFIIGYIVDVYVREWLYTAGWILFLP